MELQSVMTRLFFVLLLLSVAVGCRQPVPTDFRVAVDDGFFDSRQYRGEVIYLDFWATWCAPCVESFPWMGEMQVKYRDQGLRVLAVSLDQDRFVVKRFTEEIPADFQIAYDAKGAVADVFGVKAMPTSVIIGRQGQIISSHAGFNKVKALDYEHAILKALKE